MNETTLLKPLKPLRLLTLAAILTLGMVACGPNQESGGSDTSSTDLNQYRYL